MVGRLGKPLPRAGGEDHTDEFWGSRSAGEHLRALVRRKWIVLAILAAFLVLAVVHILTITPIYMATALIHVEKQIPKVLPYEDVAEPSSGTSDTRAELQTVSTMLRSGSLARRVVEKLALQGNPEFHRPVRRGFPLDILGATMRFARRSSSSNRSEADQVEASVGRLLANLSNEPLGDSRLISLSYRSPSAALAAQIINTLSHEFIEQTMETRYQAAILARDFLERQARDIQATIETSEERLLEYDRTHSITDLREQQSINGQKLERLNSELMDARIDLAARESRYAASKNMNEDGLPATLKSKAMLALEDRILELEQKLATILNDFGEDWPEVVRYRVGLEQLREQLAQEQRATLDGLNEERLLAADRRARLSQAVVEQQRIIAELDQKTRQHSVYSRDLDTNRRLHDDVLQRAQEVAIASARRSSNILIAEEALVPTAAAWPNRSQLLAGAAFLGLLLGVGVALVIDAKDDTLRTTDDVGALLGLPAIGSAPHFVQPNGTRASANRSPLIVYQPDRQFQRREWEAYLSFRTSALLSAPGHPRQVILLTSALPGDGKSTVAANLAIALAQAGRRTVLLELDLRRPQMAKLFGAGLDRGVTNYLRGNRALADEIQETRFPNLSLIPAGPIPSNPVELLGSERMKEGLLQLRQRFDFVVIDTPPSLELSDTWLLSRHADGVILVARASTTSKAVLRTTAERIGSIGGTVLGVFLNDVRRHDYYYYDRYDRGPGEASAAAPTSDS